MSSAAVQRSNPQQYGQDNVSRDHYTSRASVSANASPASSRRADRSNPPANSLFSDPPHQSTFIASPYSATQSREVGSDVHIPADPYSPSSSYYGPGDMSRDAETLPIRTATRHVYTSSPMASPEVRLPSGKDIYQTAQYARDGEQELDRRRQQQYDTKLGGQLQSDSTLPRENSTILNHIVIDDPKTDLVREKVRIAESLPNTIGTAKSNVAAVSGNFSVPVDNNMPTTVYAPSPPQATPQRSRQEHLKQANPQRKEVKFGEYILGQTLGEGEFGKVKMGWKKDSNVQVAIKLIRKESLAGNTTRLPKIYREIAILRGLQHPNIVRLHEFVETERHMGIILEYASGGELFDYILNHRYLKDPAARRLFAQLVSGVGYLHRRGIVHRDLKLENLLLDRNRNIIITDFGFANTFNPDEELGEEVERRIGDKDFLKARGLDVVKSDGHRRGDLMQTSCGSPCYAAPELVVSDGLYTGRKVDVWSCGVILYAMLAGYLPFDDDPANPEGDNINLLYKYIVSTPLTFPEYVTPHARDLLRRILVPDPRRRADLFEVARHSWLSEYSHVVGFIGSATRSDRDIAASAAQQDAQPMLGRSASVREPTVRPQTNTSTAGLQKAGAVISSAGAEDMHTPGRDEKRRTVQVEYVAPKSANARMDPGLARPQPAAGRTRVRPDSQVGAIEVGPGASAGKARHDDSGLSMSPPVARPGRDQIRGASEPNTLLHYAPATTARPNTGGAFVVPRLPSRGNSYSTPVAATPTTENAQGRFSQPKPSGAYMMSGPAQADLSNEVRPASQQTLGQFPKQPQQMPKGHKRSSTLGSLGDRLLGRSNSRRNSQQTPEASAPSEKKNRKYPPVSMRNNVQAGAEDYQPRPSSESRRTSFGFNRKNSDIQPGEKRSSRRFSFLPSNFSITNLGGGRKESSYDDNYGDLPRPSSKGMLFNRAESPSPSPSMLNNSLSGQSQRFPMQKPPSQPPSRNSRYETTMSVAGSMRLDPPTAVSQRKQVRNDSYGDERFNMDEPERFYTPSESHRPTRNERQEQVHYNAGPRDGYDYEDVSADVSQQSVPAGLRPSQRKFGDAYEQGHAGSSSGARRVMDFFRRRGKERSTT